MRSLKPPIFVFLTVFTIGLGPMQASAIRVIGNGGGTTEMQALSVFGILPTVIKICALESNPCNLAGKSVEFLQTQMSSFDSLTPLKLDFRMSAEIYTYDAKGRVLTLNPTALEQLRERIHHIVLDAFSGAMNFQPQISSEIATRLFDDRQWEFRSMFTSAGTLVWLKGPQVAALVHIDNNGSLEDLTPSMVSGLECGNSPKDLRLFDLARGIESTLEGKMHWVCSGQSMQAKFTAIYDRTGWRFYFFSVSAS